MYGNHEITVSNACEVAAIPICVEAWSAGTYFCVTTMTSAVIVQMITVSTNGSSSAT